jgi:hypothetical protein
MWDYNDYPDITFLRGTRFKVRRKPRYNGPEGGITMLGEIVGSRSGGIPLKKATMPILPGGSGLLRRGRADGRRPAAAAE